MWLSTCILTQVNVQKVFHCLDRQPMERTINEVANHDPFSLHKSICGVNLMQAYGFVLMFGQPNVVVVRFVSP